MKLTLTDDPTVALDKDGNTWYLSFEWEGEDPTIKWIKQDKDEMKNTLDKCTCTSYARCAYCLVEDLKK